MAKMIRFPYDFDGSSEPFPEFEFDPGKSETNLRKHGIDFETAKAIWADPQRSETPARIGSEMRYGVVGLIDGKHWTAFVTHRGERIRIISVRRSRPAEVIQHGRSHA